MQIEDHKAFTLELKNNLESRTEVSALISLTSSSFSPDQWSDHNFFIVTQPGQQEQFRTQLDWIPHSKDIALYFQDTTHGLKVFFQDGQLLDFSVFDKSELFLAQIDSFEILFDKAGGIDQEIDQIRQMTALRSQTNQAPLEIMWGRFLFYQSTAMNRWKRGEVLSAYELLKHRSLEILLNIILQLDQGLTRSALDNLDIFRHWEQISPTWARFINQIILLPADQYIIQLWKEMNQSLIPALPPVCQKWARWFTEQFPRWDIA